MLLNFVTWDVSPEIFHIGPISIRWYGLLFAMSFLIGQQLLFYIFKKDGKPESDVEMITIYVVVATVLGARLGHVLFYQPDFYFANPIEILKIWEGGLASHGATVAILLAIWLYSKKKQGQSFLWVVDRIVITVALGGAFIRLGNLANSEIYGKPTNVPWAFIYALPEGIEDQIKDKNPSIENINVSSLPGDTTINKTYYRKIKYNVYVDRKLQTGPDAINYVKSVINSKYGIYEEDNEIVVSALRDNVFIDEASLHPSVVKNTKGWVVSFEAYGKPRHPTQIYEALFCIFLLLITFWLWSKKRQVNPEGVISAVFIIFLFAFRFFVEYLKKEQVDFEKNLDINMGQILSIPAVLFGIGILIYAYKKRNNDLTENKETLVK